MKFAYLLAILMFIAVSVFASPFSTQKGGHCYTVDIPDYMASTFDLNDVATLQYQNVNKEAYTIVIEDNKTQLENLGVKFVNPTDFLNQFVESYMADALDRSVSTATEFIENNNKHSQLELKWTLEGSKFFMLITVVETKTHFYKILSWSLEANKQQQYDDFIKISRSLKD